MSNPTTSGWCMEKNSAVKRRRFLQLFRKQKGLCAICGHAMDLDKKGPRAGNLDHILPKSLGGSNRIENLRATHKYCNQQRGRDMSGVFIQHNGVTALCHNIRSIG
jgi:5-methylcytosine-specific restriction endonuclease McrA